LTPDQIDDVFPTVMDFPQPGIAFRDITPLMASPKRHALIKEWARRIQDPASGMGHIDGIVYLEARGWIFASIEEHFPAADARPAVIMARKPGKLPGATVSQAYGYEYAQSVLHVSVGTIIPDKRYLVVDDIAVTLGTARAACELIKKCGGVVAGVSCLLSIDGLAKPDALECPFLALLSVPLVSRNAANEVQPVLRPLLQPMLSQVYQPQQQRLLAGITRGLPQQCVLFADPVQANKVRAIAAYLPQLFRTGVTKNDVFPDKHINSVAEHPDQLCGQGKHLAYWGTLFTPADMGRQYMALSALSEQTCSTFTAEMPYFATGTHERVVNGGAYYDENEHQFMKTQAIATTKSVLKAITACTSGSESMLRVCDVHTPGFPFYADSTRLKFLAESSMVPTLLRMIRLRKWHTEVGFAVVFLDAGAKKKYAPRFQDVPYITCDKVRGSGEDRVVTIADYHLCDAATKFTHLLFVDDLVQSGSTIANGLAAFKHVYAGVEVSVWVTHPVFPNDSHLHFLPGGKYAGLRNFFACDTVPEVAAKLRAVGAPFHVVGTTPMAVQAYLEQYGWTKDPRAASFYAPETIVVCSTNGDKLEAARRAFYTHFPEKPLQYVKLLSCPASASSVPEQPVGSEETLRGCEARIAGVPVKVSNDATYLAAFERGLVLVAGTKHEWRDQTCVIVQKMHQGRILAKATVWSRALAIEREYVDAALATNCTQTAGSFKAAKEGLASSSDWYQSAHGVSCVDLMQEAIQSAISKIQEEEAFLLGAL